MIFEILFLIAIITWIGGALAFMPGAIRKAAFKHEELRQQTIDWQGVRQDRYQSDYEKWLAGGRKGTKPSMPPMILQLIDADRNWTLGKAAASTMAWPFTLLAAPVHGAAEQALKLMHTYEQQGIAKYQQVSASLAIENPKPGLQHSYDKLVAYVTSVTLPATVKPHLERIDASIRKIIRDGVDMLQTFTVERILDDYLPTSVRTYLDIPVNTRSEQDEAKLIEQLSIMSTELSSIAQGLDNSKKDALTTQGHFLEGKFKFPVSSLDLSIGD